MSALTIPSQHCTEGLGHNSKQEGKKHSKWKVRSKPKFPLFTDDMIGYAENFQESTKNLL